MVKVRSIVSQTLLPIIMAAIIFSCSILIAVAGQIGDVKGIYIRFFDEMSRILSGVNAFVQVWAVDPESIPSTVNVYYGRLVGGELLIGLDNRDFRRVLDSWNRLYPKDHNYETFMGVFIWVIMDSRVLTYPLIIVNYNPLSASKSLIRKDIKINVYSLIPEGVMPEWTREVSEAETVTPSSGGYPLYMWIRDNQLSWESQDYVQVPILIVHNDKTYSGVLSSYIDIKTEYKIGSRITIGYGLNIREKLLNAISPTIKFTINLPSRKGNYNFGKSLSIPPNMKRYIWIGAKVAHVHYREAYAYPDTGQVIYYTGNEMILEYISDFQLNGNNIVGGWGEGSPPYENIIFNGTLEENLIINGTALSDGDLDVNETVWFWQIFQCYDVYNVDSEVGLPIGAIIALMSDALGFGTGSVATVIISLLSGIGVSLSYVSSVSARIGGDLTNWGQEDALGYNVPETVYIRVSKYQYQAPNGQYFKVPIGIYFRCY